MKDQLEAWKKEAYKLGVEHAEAAATWVTDGNEPAESIRAKLRGFEDGDPRVLDMMPPAPNLSGEWSGDLTPQALATRIAGGGLDNVADESDLIDELAEAYEKGVGDTYLPGCEAALRQQMP